MASSSREKLSSKSLSKLSKTYLLLYNLAQFVGWSIIFVLAVQHLIITKKIVGLWKAVDYPLKIFQTLAILEIFHCCIRIVPSSALITFFQVFSRLFVTWAVTHSVKQAQNNIGVTLYVIAWSITEIIRYPFYLTNLITSTPYLLSWCRYTFFFLLYPLGALGELLTIIAALPAVKKHKVYFVELPNKANFSFDYYYFLIVIIILYIPLFPKMYCHMIHQRKKFMSSLKDKRQ